MRYPQQFLLHIHRQNGRLNGRLMRRHCSSPRRMAVPVYAFSRPTGGWRKPTSSARSPSPIARPPANVTTTAERIAVNTTYPPRKQNNAGLFLPAPASTPTGDTSVAISFTAPVQPAQRQPASVPALSRSVAGAILC
ncbi:hypothetical protein KCP73_15690 [Salmonella enterica subsp. enterica]|nr:hypothetical protein KCP73_15690 [Salmonella enterica subsp. enterica]